MGLTSEALRGRRAALLDQRGLLGPAPGGLSAKERELRAQLKRVALQQIEAEIAEEIKLNGQLDAVAAQLAKLELEQHNEQIAKLRAELMPAMVALQVARGCLDEARAERARLVAQMAELRRHPPARGTPEWRAASAEYFQMEDAMKALDTRFFDRGTAGLYLRGLIGDFNAAAKTVHELQLELQEAGALDAEAGDDDRALDDTGARSLG